MSSRPGMRILIQLFGYSLEFSRDEPVVPPAPYQPQITHSAQTDFGFTKPLNYPDERWTDS